MAHAQGTVVTVPHLAESLVAATVGKWLKQPGDSVKLYEVICELITEKVNVEMPSPIEGVLRQILLQDGQTGDVGQPMCIIEETGQSAGGSGAGQTASVAGTGIEYVGASGHSHVSAAAGQLSVDTALQNRFSPAVLKLANENGVDLSQIHGTGIGGRITRKDVAAFVESGQASQKHKTVPVIAASVDPRSQTPVLPVRTTGIHLSQNPATPFEILDNPGDSRGDTSIDVTPIRNTIASRMRQSVAEIPHAWTMIEVDVTNLVQLRNKLKDEFIRKEGFNLTYLAFLIKAVVSAIKDYPIMNSMWAVDKIIIKREINISLAIGTEDMVVTPTIKKADLKNIAGLAGDINELTNKARTGKLSLSDIQGGTFTVNNTGSFGSILSYPIINYPQAAILTFEQIVKRPVVIQDMIAVRQMVNLCLSLDHRILDGVICGRFLQRVKENIESYTIDTKIY